MLALGCAASPARAGESVYSRLDIGKDCRQDGPEQAGGEDEQDGFCTVCAGHGRYRVRLCEGDLRMSLIYYGTPQPPQQDWQSFAQFNHVGKAVEWRIAAGQPTATILRWFIENANDSGIPDDAHRGQTLVVQTVARQQGEISCPVGFVDARANPDANDIARKIADEIAPSFRCGVDMPAFHGVRGPLAGNPTGIDE